MKLKSCPSNPAHDCTFNLKYKEYFERKGKTIKPFSLRRKSALQESKIPLNHIHESTFSQTPPWIIKTPKVILKLNEHSKTKTHPSTYQEKFHNILQQHPDHLYVFTDGSKDNNKTVCVAVFKQNKALPMESSIFTAEAHAIDIALNIILKSKYKKFIIFSDSLSVLLSLRNKKFHNPLFIKMLSRLDSMSNRKEIIISWTLSHIGVRGNEIADLVAKLVLDLTPDKSRIPYTDLKSTINKVLHKKWQQRWSNNIHNKLFQIQPTLGEWRPALKKFKKRTSRYIPIAHWSYKAYSLFQTKTGTTTTVFDLSDNLLS